MPAARASLASEAKRSAPAISPTSLAAVSGPAARLGDQLGRDCGHELCDLGFEGLDRGGQFAQPTQLVAGDPDAHRLLGARQAPRDLDRPLLREQRAAGNVSSGQRSCRFHCSVLLSATRVLTSRSRWSTRSRMSSSGPASAAVGSVSIPAASAARATAIASIWSLLPRSRLERRVPAISRVETRTTRSPRPIKNRSSAPETCRQSSNAQTRSPSRPRAQTSSAANPRAPTCDRLVAEHLAGRDVDAQRPCANACGCPPRARS